MQEDMESGQTLDDSTHVTGGTGDDSLAVSGAGTEADGLDAAQTGEALEDETGETPDEDLVRESDPDSVRVRINKLKERLASKDAEIEALKARMLREGPSTEPVGTRPSSDEDLLAGYPKDELGNVYYNGEWTHPDYAVQDLKHRRMIEELSKRIERIEQAENEKRAEEARAKILGEIEAAIEDSIESLFPKGMPEEQFEFVRNLIGQMTGKLTMESLEGEFDPKVAKKLVPEAAKKVRSYLGFFGNEQIKTNTKVQQTRAVREPPSGQVPMEGKRTVWEMDDSERNRFIEELSNRIFQE